MGSISEKKLWAVSCAISAKCKARVDVRKTHGWCFQKLPLKKPMKGHTVLTKKLILDIITENNAFIQMVLLSKIWRKEEFYHRLL